MLVDTRGETLMNKSIWIVLALTAAGCDSADAKAQGAKKSDSAEIAAARADNTKKNERDRDDAALTPGDQGESKADREVTQAIRQGVVKSDSVSFTGKNVKIITVDGVVTLRGPVGSVEERTAIGELAQNVAGVKRVDNQLEVAAK